MREGLTTKRLRWGDIDGIEPSKRTFRKCEDWVRLHRNLRDGKGAGGGRQWLIGSVRAKKRGKRYLPISEWGTSATVVPPGEKISALPEAASR